MEFKVLHYDVKNQWGSQEFPAWDSTNTLILIFAAPKYFKQQETIFKIVDQYPNSCILGCSSAGEICGSDILDDSVTAAVIKFKDTRLKAIEAKVANVTDSFEAGKKIVNELQAQELKSIFVLSDGLNVNGSKLVEGLNSVSCSHPIITGGLAGDGNKFQQTWVLFNRKIQDHHVAAVGMYGKKLQVGHASRGGWDIFGPIRKVTKAKDNILYELDYQPALQLYKKYLGDKASELPSSGLLFPLAIIDPITKKPFLVRTILSINEKEQSLIFAGNIPVDSHVQLMRANFDRLIESAGEAAQMTKVEELNKPVINIAISCVGRRLVLGERTEEETESVMSFLPPGSQQVGFYSYGEISPFTNGKCELHNQTMTLTTFHE